MSSSDSGGLETIFNALVDTGESESHKMFERLDIQSKDTDSRY